MGISFPMKLITIQMDLVIPSESVDVRSLDSIAEFLNVKLYDDPEFFGDFGPENIIKVQDLES